MSPTVSPPADSAEASLEERPPAAPSGAWRWTTVVVLPLSIAPVPSSTATITATTSPPSAPAKRLDLPFTTPEGRAGRLIRRKTRVRRDGQEPAQAREGAAAQEPAHRRKRAAAVRERAPQSAPVARRRRVPRPRSRVTLLAQQPHVPRRTGAGRDLQPALQLGERRAGRVVVAQAVERPAQLRHGALSPARVEMRPAAGDRHQPQDRERERNEHE